MNSITFLLAIHNHQPVGNFDNVVEDAYQHSYRPFLETLERHPSLRVGVHNSGCLIDWFEAHRPEYLDLLGRLTERGQVELMGGGYYEPILPSIPEEDRVGQIQKLTAYLERRFGQTPVGLWLTERVWEPSLVQSLAQAGVRYTMTDDSHFLAAGLRGDQLWGTYLTEDQGVPLRVYPISKELRYLIPFQPPEKTIEFLRSLADEGPGKIAILGDDGEKFGVWPETYKLVYEEGWLERFFSLLEENQEWLQVRFPREVLDTPPLGKVYLPTASYTEMMEWSLPAEEQNRYLELLHHVEQNVNNSVKFVRGGFWRNFFARYPESDHINKRMIRLRRRVDALGPAAGEAASRARDLLWAAQCNCAYWHGVFGGLYLPHLRDALYERLLEAEHVLDQATGNGAGFADVDFADFDCDGDDEIFLSNPELTLVASGREGGVLQEISVKPLRVALSNGISRRPEAYHGKVAQAVFRDGGSGGGDGEEIQSIHDLVLAKEPDLARLLHYDDYRRAALHDHFFADDATRDSFETGGYNELGDFFGGAYEVVSAERTDGVVCSFRRTGTVWSGGDPVRVAVEKRVRLSRTRPAFEVEYQIENLSDRPLETIFGVEWNFGLLAGNSPDHRYRIPGVPDEESALGSRGETQGVSRVELIDRHRGFQVGLSWSDPAELWRFPVETVSLSEAGFERIYQFSCLTPRWARVFEPGVLTRLSFQLEVGTI